MTTLSEGEPSLERAIEAFWRNAEYSTTGSTEQVREFIVACRQLLLLMPSFSEESLANSRMAYNTEQIQGLMRDAQQWLAQRSRRTRYAQTNYLRRWGQ